MHSSTSSSSRRRRRVEEKRRRRRRKEEKRRRERGSMASAGKRATAAARRNGRNNSSSNNSNNNNNKTGSNGRALRRAASRSAAAMKTTRSRTFGATQTTSAGAGRSASEYVAQAAALSSHASPMEGAILRGDIGNVSGSGRTGDQHERAFTSLPLIDIEPLVTYMSGNTGEASAREAHPRRSGRFLLRVPSQ